MFFSLGEKFAKNHILLRVNYYLNIKFITENMENSVPSLSIC
jgi:hypothetical protein